MLAKDSHTTRAVVLLVGLAVVAVQARPDLRTNTNSVADLDGLDIAANLDSSANDLVANAKRHGSIAPSTCLCQHDALVFYFESEAPTGDRVNVGATDTACIDGNVNVALAELLQLELEGC